MTPLSRACVSPYATVFSFYCFWDIQCHILCIYAYAQYMYERCEWPTSRNLYNKEKRHRNKSQEREGRGRIEDKERGRMVPRQLIYRCAAPEHNWTQYWYLLIFLLFLFIYLYLNRVSFPLTMVLLPRSLSSLKQKLKDFFYRIWHGSGWPTRRQVW